MVCEEQPKVKNWPNSSGGHETSASSEPLQLSCCRKILDSVFPGGKPPPLIAIAPFRRDEGREGQLHIIARLEMFTVNWPVFELWEEEV